MSDTKLTILISALITFTISSIILGFSVAYIDYQNNKLPEYKSRWGVSFEYYDNFQVITEIQGNRYIYITPRPDYSTEYGMIIISFAQNDENLTPEGWLLSEDSGFNEEFGYSETKIGGESAVITEDKMWAMVNTPDDKTRISIADLTRESERIPKYQMKLLLKTFSFE